MNDHWFACKPCRFPTLPDSGAETFSAQWHREHKEHHLAVFPHLVDESFQRSIRNLDEFVAQAEQQEAV